MGDFTLFLTQLNNENQIYENCPTFLNMTANFKILITTPVSYEVFEFKVLQF